MSILSRVAGPSVADDGHWTEWRGPISKAASAIVKVLESGTSSGCRVTEDSALRSTAVWRAVSLLSSLPAYLPLMVFRSREDGGADKARDHRSFRLLYARPNPWQTSFQWRQHCGMHLHTRGNSYSALRINQDGAIDRIVPIHPDRVTIHVDDDGLPVYEIAPKTIDGESVRLGHHEMHHLKLHSLDGYTGLSPIAAAREGIGLALGGEEYGARFLSNGGVLSGILTVPPGTNAEAKTAAKKSWMKGHAGLSNMHKIAVLENGMDFKPISMSAVDAQWIEMRKFQVEEIARLYGIPPELLQHTSPVSSWGTGVEQRFLAFLATTLDTILVAWEQEMQLDFFDEDELDIVYPRFNRAALLRTDTLTRYRVYALGRQWGLLSADECRSLEEMNPIGGEAGATYLGPLNMERVPANAVGDPIVTETAARLDESEARRFHPLLEQTVARVYRRAIQDLPAAERKGQIAEWRAAQRAHAAEQLAPIIAAMPPSTNIRDLQFLEPDDARGADPATLASDEADRLLGLAKE